MPTPLPNEMTPLLPRWSQGQETTLSQLLPTLYQKLHSHPNGVAAQLMRQIPVERARSAEKRGGGERKYLLDEALTFSEEKAAELIALDDALAALAQFDERKVRIIELRYFGGLSLEETADALNISIATIGHEMRLARAWLRREMER